MVYLFDTPVIENNGFPSPKADNFPWGESYIYLFNITNIRHSDAVNPIYRQKKNIEI